MNRTFWLDIFRMIRKTKGRFILLSLIIALGVSFFVGIKSSAPFMAYSVESYNDNYNLMDITVYSTYGFDDKDIQALKKINNVNEVYGINFIDVYALRNQSEIVLRVHSINENINNFKLVEGKMPQNNNECVVEKKSILSDSYNIGDIIKVSRNDDYLNEMLLNDTFKVVGFISSPYYINDDKGFSTLNNRIINSYIYINNDNFKNEYFTEVAIVFDKKLNSFTNEYQVISDAIKDEIEKLSKTQILNRKNSVLNEATAKYNDGLKDYKEAEKEFNDKINEASKKIADGKQKIIDGEKEVKEGYKTLADNKVKADKEFLEAEIKINDERNNLGVKEAEYVKAKEEFAKKEEEYTAIINQINLGLNQIDNGIIQANDGINNLNASINQINQNIALIDEQLAVLDSSNPGYAVLINQKNELLSNLNILNANLEQVNNTLNGLINKKNELIAQKTLINNGLNEGRNKLAIAGDLISRGYQEITNAAVKLDEKKIEIKAEFVKAENKLKQAKKDLQQAKIDLEKAINTYEEKKLEGNQKLTDARADLDKAKQDIEDIKNGEWIVVDRELYYATKTFRDTIKQMMAIGNVFPIFFFLVSSLVCLTTITRMIDEQRSQIGIYRALGYSKNAIYIKYMAYAFLATFIGNILGNVFGLIIFPPVIYQAWEMMYVLPEFKMYLPVNLILMANVSFIMIMVLTAYFACYGDIKEVPAALLRFKNTLKGKKIILEKISFIWKKLSFTSKVTARNLIRYKKRFFMTVSGVAGCTALILTGLGIRDSLSTIVHLQFDVIYKYDGIVNLEKDITVSDTQKVLSDLKNNENIEYAVLGTIYSSKIYFNDKHDVANICVFEKDEINQVYTLKTRKNNQMNNLDNEGIIISEKIAELLNIKVNDKITIESFNGVLKEVNVSGITEMYVNHHLFISDSYYKKIFNTTLRETSILLKGNNIETLKKEILKVKNVDSIFFYDIILNNFNSMIEGLNMIVYVIVFSSASLAFVVLSNLTNINISERQREIATLKVLGFTQVEVIMYIFKENMILTIIGSLIGVPLGSYLHQYIILLVEMDEVMFGRNVYFRSILTAVGLTMLFSVLINLIMSRQLKKIHMVESLKSIE